MAKIQSFVCDELVKLETKILNRGSNEEVNDKQQDESDKDEHKEEEKEHYSDEDEDEQPQDDEVMTAKIGEQHQNGQKWHDDEQQEEEDEDEDKDENIRENEAVEKEAKTEEGNKDGKMVTKVVELLISRSNRHKVLVVKSPCMFTYARKVKMSDKDTFYTACTEWCQLDEAKE
ncbi:acidic leucine-rich nuclear phosphoprotein 32 family member B-like [Neltuma alba]|uniref:acidic leucine-rich nuclear phosphoprotein 32 family member B-like n=1 Tax=Neltuma alba TaxID=207710 RepID=UPI0010A464FC|nr:acidic leucine-rich nuclear phosphoprotein 32 family member B-like [Prosopis alba]